MKILHTSDWHLGKKLYGKNRENEFGAFLEWLHQTLQAEKIDALLIAGDIFDTTTPNNKAQALYYKFLNRVTQTHCRHVVIIAGNHDSPTFLEAPKTLLKNLNVHVIGTPELSEDILTLRQSDGSPEMVVAAIPYLRDRDIRKVQAGESITDKSQKLRAGITHYYKEAAQIAAEAAAQAQRKIPVVAMGHLFTAGGATQQDDGVRELYVGSLAHVEAHIFDPIFDYVALGHLHVPQKVAKTEHIRYSGSPIAMGFGEATQQKQVVVVDFSQTESLLKIVPVPCFQPLLRLKGDLETLCKLLSQIKTPATWLEIIYTGDTLQENLRERLEDEIKGTEHELLRIENKRLVQQMLTQSYHEETLESLTPTEVFTQLLVQNEVPVDQQEELQVCYHEVLTKVQEKVKS